MPDETMPPQPVATGKKAEMRPAGAWADAKKTEDWQFNGANAAEKWLATIRTVKTRKSRLEPGRDVTEADYDAAIKRCLAVTAG